jgi:hypothetical protein
MKRLQAGATHGMQIPPTLLNQSCELIVVTTVNPWVKAEAAVWLQLCTHQALAKFALGTKACTQIEDLKQAAKFNIVHYIC